jgi:two-component system heavy metal sensor histidine kinase CusS
VRLGNEAGQAVISVENPGEIPAQHLPRLFDRFYTGDPARRASGEGAGLGLAITRSIVAAHGGSITATSEAGVTRFRVALPTA